MLSFRTLGLQAGEHVRLMGYGTIHTADGMRVRWAYFGRP